MDSKSEDQIACKIEVDSEFDQNSSGTSTDVSSPDVVREKLVDYEVDDVPPWYLSILLAFQHLLTMVSGIVAIPLLLAKPLCMEDSTSGYADDLGKAELISSLMFMSGIITFLQVTFGARLPIVQGSTQALLPPTFALLSAMGGCPSILPATANRTEYMEANPDMNYVVLAGSDEHQQIWKTRLRAVQGAIMVASAFEIIVGFSGVLGYIIKYIGPLVIAPTLMMIALPLFKIAASNAGSQWGIAAFTMIMMVAFSEYMKNIKIPGCRGREGIPIFRLFPVLFAMVAGYLLCVLFTYTDVFPNDPNHPLFLVRTDLRSKVISEAQWFRMPYPGQWGVPTVTLAGTIGIISGLVASILESIGDYHACARLSGAPPPPKSAINRGIFMEGVGTLLAGAVGTGSGTTSFSTNVAAIGITKVGSRRVIQASAIMMLIFGVMAKPMAVFVTIPPCVLGAMYITLFGLIVAIGISNLQYINLNSSRNMLILGITIMTALSLPEWIANNKDTIKTGSDVADDLIIVLLSTSMFIAGVLAFILDNTMPGTPEERGLTGWHQAASSDDKEAAKNCYDMPFGNDLIYRTKWLSYLPISPSFMSHKSKSINEEKLDEETGEKGSDTRL